MLVPIPVASSLPRATVAVAGTKFAEGDQLQIKFILQLPGLLPEIWTRRGQRMRKH